MLQTGQFERVGGNEVVVTDVRVISATNRDLPALIATERFREDLFYRLNVVTIELPALRSLKDLVAETEQLAIQHTLEQTGWNRTQVARLLGISSRQLFDKIQQFGLQQ